jgi:hypothetical protein
MSFDARSRERLEALGRRLPQKLPVPTPPAAATGDAPSGGKAPRGSDRRHAVETERNPEQLFYRLMDASPDGGVPPHLLERLKLAEELQPGRRPSSDQPADGKATTSGDGLRSTETIDGSTRSTSRSKTSPAGRRPRLAASSEDSALYSEFSQLLLEEEDDD